MSSTNAENDIIEDRELANHLMKKIRQLRQINDAVGNRRIRQQIDDYLTRCWLLARDGHEQNLNRITLEN